jgi:Rps23 Pro-64 3,4-dihydroxylase Tpa1-like proline 4-hydroxylase
MQSAAIAHIIVTRLESLKSDIQRQWNNPQGTLTRHFVVDDLLPTEVAQAIYDAFPQNADGFLDRESFREKKKTLTDLSQHPAILSAVTYAMQDSAVVAKVSELVGFEQIVPDPSLYAGGLSMMFDGDFLNPHIDNSHGANRRLYRRLNLLYYVSPGWSDQNGGAFELWDPRVEQAKSVVPNFNRLVVMETNRTSWHSVSCVQGRAVRCCVSNYYFSAHSPDQADYFHVTSFTGRPSEIGRRMWGKADNCLRNAVSKSLRLGRNQSRVNRLRK